MIGKQKCKILKEIRQKIADENDIPYVTRECRHQGNCRGTCPQCESELRYLENQLKIRMSLGKKIKVAALCAGMVLTAAGCETIDMIGSKNHPGEETSGMVPYEVPTPTQPEDVVFVTEGEVPWPSEDEDTQIEVRPTQTSIAEFEKYELMGIAPAIEEPETNR